MINSLRQFFLFLVMGCLLTSVLFGQDGKSNKQKEMPQKTPALKELSGIWDMDKHKGGDFYLTTSATETYVLKAGKDPQGFADFHKVRMKTMEITVLGLVASATAINLRPVIFVEACWERKQLAED